MALPHDANDANLGRIADDLIAIGERLAQLLAQRGEHLTLPVIDTVERLQGAALQSPSDVTLAGQSFGAQTTTGRIGGSAQRSTVKPIGAPDGRVITLPLARSTVIGGNSPGGLKMILCLARSYSTNRRG